MNGTSSDFEPVVFRLADMDGFEFEDAIQTLFERLGYDAEVAERVADLGRDVIARADGETIIVECKHTSSKISRPDVQKVHSAALSFDSDSGGSTRAILVSTGGFTGPARDYASDELDDGTVELWTYDTLVDKGRQVDAYFPSEEAGTDHIFRTPRRSPDDIVQLVDTCFVSNLDSHPRDLDEHTDIRVDDLSEVPALLLEHELDETFGTSTYPRLHRAASSGRTLVTLDATALDAEERRLWEHARFSVDCRDEHSDSDLAEKFAIHPSDYEARLQRRVAREASTTVRYTGRNNQTYTKQCHVDPDDVSVTSRQVLLHRQHVSLDIGPNAQTLVVAEQPSRDSVPVDTNPIDLSRARALWDGTRGTVCNDCAVIQLSTDTPPPVRCSRCDRTLCAAHNWRFPAWWPGSGEQLCSSCYRTRSDERPDLTEGYDAGAHAALVPVIGLARNGHWVGLAVLAAVFAATASLAGVVGIGDPNTVVGYWVSGVVWLAAGTWLALQMRRSDTIRQDLAALRDYEPDWQ